MISCKIKIGDTMFPVKEANGESAASSVEFKLDTDRTLKAVCLNVMYKKKVYQPCEIVAKVQITVNKGSAPTPAELGKLFLNKPVELEVGNNQVASKYYVHEIVPQYTTRGGASIYVDFHIYSNDKKLTLDKYCKAYTGRKLVEEILKADIQLVDENWKDVDNAKDSTVQDLLKSADVTIADDSQLQFLSYTRDNEKHEFIQPYLVQYNESFYDFLARTANRCGEFMFFENGSLYVGLPTTIKKKEITSYTSLEYHCTDCLSITSVKDQYYNGVNKKANIVADCDDEVYDFQISHDEYFTKYVKDGWTNWWKELNFKLPKEMTKVLSKALNNSTAAKVMASYALTLSKDAVWAAAKSKSNNKEKNEKFYDNFQNEQKATSEDNKQYAAPFSSAFEKNNLTSVLYSEISKYEQTAEQGAITLRMGENGANLFLADEITVNDEHYIVTDIEGSIGDMAEYKVTAVPILKIGDSDLICPQPFGGESTRKSAPQIAIVADIDDPSRLARVRIRYPWQKEDQDMSPWIRMAVPFAPDSGGIYFEPTVGTELLIDYTGGNVERPYVVGQLFARDGKTSKALDPETRVIASTNGQKIVLDDEDPGDMFSGLSTFTDLMGAELPDIEKLKGFTGGIKMTDAYGIYTISMSSVDRNIAIKSPFGDVDINAFTGIKISAPNGDIAITGKNVKITANNKLEIVSGKNIYDDSYWSNVGKNFKKFATDELFGAVADTVLDNTILSVITVINMELIRTVFEAFAPPKSGNLSIKSNRYLALSAGKGKVEMPSSAFTGKKLRNDSKEKADLINVVAELRTISPTIDGWIEECKNDHKDVVSKINALKNTLETNTTDENGNDWTAAGINDIVKEMLNKGRNGKFSGFTVKDLKKFKIRQGNSTDPKVIITCGEQLASAMNGLTQHVKKPNWDSNGLFDESLQPTLFKEEIKADKDVVGDPKVDSDEIRQIKRKLVVKYIKASSLIEVNDKKEKVDMSKVDTDDKEWVKMANSIDEKDNSSISGTIADILIDYGKEKLNSLVPIEWFKSRDTWGTLKSGEILFSDKSGKTINFEHGHLNYAENTDAHIDKIKETLKEDF